MSRPAKKFIYGFFYLAVLVLIAFGFYNLFLKPAPTCFDKIQNQGETGIDCGGPCPSCGLKNIQPLRVLNVNFFGTIAGQTVILADARNPNNDYGAASVHYQFLIYDKSNQLIETLDGRESFNQAEEKYIFSADAKTNFQKIEHIELQFSNPAWQSANAFLPKPNLTLNGNPKTVLVGQSLQVSGTVFNQDPLSLTDVKIVALLFDKFGRQIFASQTLVANLQGGGTANFVVIFPSDPNLNTKFDPQATKIIFSSQ